MWETGRRSCQVAVPAEVDDQAGGRLGVERSSDPTRSLARSHQCEPPAVRVDAPAERVEADLVPEMLEPPCEQRDRPALGLKQSQRVALAAAVSVSDLREKVAARQAHEPLDA